MNINTPALFLKMDAIINGESYDSSGNLLNAAVTNAVVQADDTFGSCTSFDGVDAYLSAGQTTLGNSLAPGATTFSITCWVSPSALSSTVGAAGLSNVFFASGSSSDNNCLLGISSTGQLQALLSSNGATLMTFGTAELAVSGWHFVAIAVNGSSVTVQIDSLSYAATTSAGALAGSSTDVVTIGATAIPDSYFPGLMANLRVYNATLAASDIIAVMNADLSSELMLYIPLSESTSDATPDYSTYAYPAVPEGNPLIVPEPQFGTVMSFSGTSQYIAIDQLTYTPDMALTEITVQAWINTVADTAMVVASFDATNYWELDLVVDLNSPGDLVVSWTTVDENGVADTLTGSVPVNDGQWHFISATYHAGDGTKTIYIDAESDTSSIAHSGLPLGNSNAPVRYGFIGIGSQASTFNGTTTGNAFTGLMCQFWLYHQALTPDTILRDMEASLSAAASYWIDYPLVLSLHQDNQENTLFIYETLSGQALTATIINTSAQAITFSAQTGTPDATTYQLAIVFRPGTLSQDTITTISLVESTAWNMAVSQVGGLVTLYLTSATNFTLYTMDRLTLTFSDVGANAAGGARTTRVQLAYNNINYLGSSDTLSGSTEIVAGIVNHSGQQNVPLHAGFLTGGSVWNGAGNSNALSIVLLNVMQAGVSGGQQGLSFTAGSDAPTSFILYFEGEEDGGSDPAALNTYDALQGIVVTVDGTYNGGVGWTVTPGMDGASPYWTITPLSGFQLLPDQSLQINLTGIVASAQAGIANVYIAYENLPGYWDGEFILEIEKSNVYSDGTHLGIGTGTPQYALSINAVNTGLDTPGTNQLALYNGGMLSLLLDAQGNLQTGVSGNAAGNITMNTGSLTVTSGNINMTSGTLTLNNGNVSVLNGTVSSSGNFITTGNANQGLYFYQAGNTGNQYGALVSDGGGGLQLVTGTTSPLTLGLHVNATQNVGIGIAGQPGVGLTVTGGTSITPGIVSGNLVVGNPTVNYLAFDFGNITSKYQSSDLSYLNLNGSNVNANGSSSVNLQINGTSVLGVSANTITIPTSTYVNNLPVITWQDVKIAVNAPNGGDVTSPPVAVTFQSNVYSAVAMLRSWTLQYTEEDNHVAFATVHAGISSISGTSVNVTLEVSLQDDSGDDPFEGEAHIIIIAMVAQIPTGYPAFH